LAHVYTLTGELDKALDQYEYLLSIPSWVTTEGLRLAPKYMHPQEKALRAHPRFKQLLATEELVL
jgi:hypothetical protein